MNHHIKGRKMKKKPVNNYLCLINNETKTGVKVTQDKPVIVLATFSFAMDKYFQTMTPCICTRRLRIVPNLILQH
jgi:hypothetical protein